MRVLEYLVNSQINYIYGVKEEVLKLMIKYASELNMSRIAVQLMGKRVRVAEFMQSHVNQS